MKRFGAVKTAVAMTFAMVLPQAGAADDGELNFGVDVSTFFMTREAPPSRPLLDTAFAIPPLGDRLNASAISPGWQPGFGVRVFRELDDARPVGFEAGGFFIAPFEDNFSAPSSIIDSAFQVFVPVQANTTTAWESKIYGFEANATYKIQDGLQLFGGLRHISLKEEVVFTYRPSGAFVNFGSDNNLFGPQLGVRADFNSLIGQMGSSPFKLDGTFAAGVLFNSASNSVTGVAGIIPSSRSKDKESPFIRASLNAGYEMSPGVDVSFGYNVLWIDNVAHATDQVGTIDPLGPISAINRFDDVLYHGAEFKITIALN